MPSGSFFSKSLTCAPVAEEILRLTSETWVAGPMPQLSNLPMRLSGEVAGLDSGTWGLLGPPPLKMSGPGDVLPELSPGTCPSAGNPPAVVSPPSSPPDGGGCDPPTPVP